MSARAMTRRYAEALIAIVGTPWLRVEYDWGWATMCPFCGRGEDVVNRSGHRDDCPWLIAARALEVQP